MKGLVRFEDQPTFVPGGHEAVVNRLLIGREHGHGDNFSVWHGTLAPKGGAEAHRHAEADQAYIGVKGRVSVRVGQETYELQPLSAVWVPAGVEHELWNKTDRDAELLVISAPALR